MANDPTQTFSQVLTPVGVNWINAGWSAMSSNANFGTAYMFYQSPVRGLAGPSANIADNLTSLGINTTVIDRVPSNALDYAQAYEQGIINSPSSTRLNAGILSEHNGRMAEAQAAADIEATGAGYFQDQRFFPSDGVGLNTQVDGVAVRESWWSGITNTQIETTIGTKSGGLSNAVTDSLYMPVETSVAQRFNFTGQLSQTGESMLVSADQVAVVQKAYGAGQIMRGFGMVATGAGVAGLGLDAYEGYKTGDYTHLVVDSIVGGALIANPLVGAGLLTAQQLLSSTSTAGKAYDEPMSAEYKARVAAEQQLASVKDYIVRVPDEYRDLSDYSAGNPDFFMVPGHQFIANPYSLGGGIDLLYPGDPRAFNVISQASASQFSSGNFATSDGSVFSTGADPLANYASYVPDPATGASQSTFSGTSYNYNYSSDPWGSGGDGGGEPVVLDLTGHGIAITQLTSSNTYQDMTGDGYKNRTAWAGAGNGVLFVDMTGAGLLTQASQVIFTRWDPGATSDMQALLDVFDTDHDGALEAGDADFSKFFVMVSNADGTQTAASLAALGISSIDLNASAAHIALPDGSSIDGETSFTITDPTTHVTATRTAATVTFAVDPGGYVVTTTTTANADGSKTVANAASNADGSLAYARILNTSANGLSKTLTRLNNAGVVATIQTDTTVVNGDGSRTETLTNYAGGTIAATGELTAAGTAGSEKLNATITTTSADGKVVNIARDRSGGGWTSQREVDTSNADGSTSIAVSDLNFDGSASNVATTAVSADGLTRTVTSLVDGLAADSTAQSDVTVVSGATRTGTVTNSAGTTVTSRVTTVTQTAANSLTRTTSSDLTDGSTLDLTSVAQTVNNADGSTTTTGTDSAANGALLDETVTQLDASGLLRTTSIDSTGATVSGAPVFDTVITDNTIVHGDGSRTETVTQSSANGTQLSQTVTDRAAGGPARTVTSYGNGDGHVTQLETVTIDGTGATMATVSDLNADGSLAGQTVTWTSADGLTKNTQIDSTGAMSGSTPIFDHITTDVTTTSGGASTETVTDYGASTGNKIDVTQTTVGADGLTSTVRRDFTGTAGVADGSWDRISVDQTAAAADGSVSETATVSDGAGHVLSQSVKATSADRRTVTITSTPGSSGLVRQVETVTTQSNGSVVDKTVNLDQNGDVLNAVVATTSADGLSRTVQDDVQGASAAAYAANGLAFDRTTAATVTINADGSRLATSNVSSRDATVLSTSSTLTSANGLSVTTTENPFATAHYASRSTDVRTINADGSSTETVSDTNYNAALLDRTTTTTSGNRLSTTVLHDFNGDGVTDQSTTDVTTINANGSRTEVVTDTTGSTSGAVRDVTTVTSGIIVANAGLQTTITRQSNGSVPTYQTETIAPSANGTVTDTVQVYSQAGGPLLKTVTTTTSANGLSKVVSTELNAGTTPDFSTSDTTVLNADGSRTETIANTNRAGLISESVTTISANGQFRTTKVDANGAVDGSGAAIFNLVTTDNTVLNAGDGSSTETVTNSSANGATISQVVTTTSADRRTVVNNSYLNETGTIATLDRVETMQTQANGSVVDTVLSYGPAHALLGTVTTTTSGNGLTKTKTWQNAAGATIGTQSDTTTYDANGDGGTLDDFEGTRFVNGATLNSSVRTQMSANGRTAITTMALTGTLASTTAASFTAVANAATAIDDSGVKTVTITDTINGAATPGDTRTIVTSADGLVTTTSTALGSSAAYIQSVSTTHLDGSRTETTTYDNPANLALIEAQTTVNTSFDGRTVTKTQQSDYDGTGYNVQTDTTVANADGSMTETRSGTGSFGAGAFSTTTNVATNADGGQTTTTLNYDASHALIGQTVSIASANGLARSFVVDTTGSESAATLNAAAAALLNGSAVPATLLDSDVLGTDIKTLNANGSTTETSKSYFGSLGKLRSQTITTTSANGLLTTRQADNDGNGTFEQVATTTRAPDGSATEVMQYYANAGVNAGQLTATNTLTTSADGLVTVLTTSTGVTDTTTTFADANGSSRWARSVTGTASGLSNGSAAHTIDANGIDTWSWSDGSPGGTSGTITIDLATERQDIAAANTIYTTMLGHAMTDAETQYLARFISNGVLDRTALATALVNSPEYMSQYRGVGLNASGFSYQVYENFLNVLGRLPTASELAAFNPAAMQTATITVQTLAQTAVAIAQYAADLTGGGVSALAGSGQGLAASFAPQPVGAAQHYAIGHGGSNGSVWAQLVGSITANGATITIPLDSSSVVSGINDVIELIGSNSAVTLNGSGDTVTAAGTGDVVTVNAMNDSVSLSGGVVNVAAGDAATVVGDNDAIAAGAGASVNVSGNNDALTLQTGSAANLSGTGENVSGSGASVTLGANSSATFSGSGNTINAANGDVITEDNAIINVAAGASVTITGTGDTVVAAGNNTITLTGGGDTVNLNGAGNTVTLNGNANADTVNGDIATDSVNLAEGTTAVVNGSGGSIYLGGSGDIVTASNEIISTANNATSETIIGSGDTVNAGIGFQGAVFGGGDTVNLSGTGNYVGLNGNGNTSADIVNGDVAGNTVAVNTDTTATVNGSGGSIYLGGSGDIVTASNETITAINNATNETIIGSGDAIFTAGGFAGAVFGSGDIVNFSGTGNYVGLNGNGNASADIVNGDFAGNSVAVNSNTTAAVNGSGGAIYLGGSGDIVTASNETITAINNATNETIIGSGDAIFTAGGFAGAVFGSGDIVNFGGTGNYVGLNGNGNSTADIVNGDVAGNSVAVNYNTTAAVNGSGGAIYIGGTGDTVTASNEVITTINNATSEIIIGSGDTINAGNGFQGAVFGGGDTVNLSGAGNYVGLNGNGNTTTDIVNGDVAGNSVAVNYNTTAAVNGSGGAIYIGGTGDVVTASNETITTINNATSEIIFGSGDTINAGNGFQGAVFGGGDTVNLTGAGNYVGLNGNHNATADTVNGDVAGNTVAVNYDTTANVNGSGGAIYIGGTGDTVTASNEVITTINNATSEIIIGSGDTINAGNGFQSAVFGSGDTVNLSGAGNYVGLNGNHNATADTVNGDVAGNTVAVNYDTTAAVNGSGGAIYIGGTGDVVTASNEVITTVNNAAGEAIIGSGDIINAGIGFQGAVIGGGDTVNLSGTGNYVGLNGNYNTSADTVNGDIAGNTVAVNYNTTAAVNGSGGAIYIGGTGDVVTASNEVITTVNNATGEAFIGSGDIINAGIGFQGAVIGGGDTVNLSGTGNYVGLNGNHNTTADIVNGDVAGNTVAVNSNTAAAVNGSGGSIYIGGSGDVVTASNENIGMAAGVTTTINGNSDTVALSTGNYVTLTGNNETVSNDIAGDTLVFGPSSSGTINGFGGDIETNGFFSGSVTGDGNTINFHGTNNSLTLYGDNLHADIVTNDIPTDNVALMGSMTAEVYGNSGHITLNASNETLTSNYEQISGSSNLTGEILNGVSNTITAGSGFSATVAGANDTVIADNSHILLVSGDNNDQVHGDHDIIVAQPNVIDFVYGNADTYNGDFGNFDGDPVTGPGDDGSSFWDDWWPDDPIVLSLDGGAVRTQGLQTSAAFFDMQNSGEKVHTGWVTAGEGLLVYDSDGRNSVTSDRDLVGGFDALKELAREVDGASSDTLSASDAIWSNLKVWVDPTGTGDFHRDQLYTLDQLGITSIDLNATDVSRNSNGNTILADSSFTRSDGTRGDMAGVEFAAAPAAPAAGTGLRLESQLQQMISAMASFGAQGAGEPPLMIAGNQNYLPIMLAASQH